MTEYPLELKHPKHWTLLFLDGLAPRLHATYAKFYDPGLDVNVAWSSRRHRKGRRVKVHHHADKLQVRRHRPRVWGFEFGNISWWVAQLFIWGSAAWCVNGWCSLFPLSDTATNINLVGWTALVGGTLFEIGAYAMVVEALNRGHTVRFGYEVKKHVESDAKYVEKVVGCGTYSPTELADKPLLEALSVSKH